MAWDSARGPRVHDDIMTTPRSSLRTNVSPRHMSFINLEFEHLVSSKGILILSVPQAWGLSLVGGLQYSSLQLRIQSSFLCSTRVWRSTNDLYGTCWMRMMFPDTIADKFKLNCNCQGWSEADVIRMRTHRLMFYVCQTKLEIRLERHFRSMQELCRDRAEWPWRSGAIMPREGVNWWGVITILLSS